jgi:hypothetical protein
MNMCIDSYFKLDLEVIHTASFWLNFPVHVAENSALYNSVKYNMNFNIFFLNHDLKVNVGRWQN